MDWLPYRTCCQRASGLDADVAFCPECGHPLLRCFAFSECRSLVTPTQACPVCVVPELMIDAGAVVQSKTGERVSVPLILRNGSPANRPIWVKRIVRWDGKVDVPVALTWEQLEPGVERHFAIDTAPLAEGGTHTLRVILVIASRYKGIEEEYAFAAGMSITVSGPDAQQVIQNINFAGAKFETGGMVNTNLNTKNAPGQGPEALKNRTQLPLERAEKYELEQGVRGYQTQNLRVPRHVEFGFSGFRSTDQPNDGWTLIGRGRLAVGRNSRTPDAGANAVGSDLCLRAYSARSGEVDEPATLAISRNHFDFVVVNDRLCVQARATRGLQINGNDLTSGQVLPIVPGDRIIPIPGHPEKVALQISFTASIGSVERINVSRTPAMKPRP